MINSILESISISLNSEFGDDYAVYMESIEQDLKKSCFFVLCMNSAGKAFSGQRYFRENQFCLQFFPADRDRAREESNAIAERLFSCLEYITVTGNLLRGTKMKCEVIDEVLNFFVNYDLFVYKETASNVMEEISQDVTVKG